MVKRLVLFMILISALLGSASSVTGEVILDAAPTQELNGTTFVSVAYDPNTTDYSDEDKVYNLVTQALEQLNPRDTHNSLANVIEHGDVVVLKPNLVGVQRIPFEGCTRTAVLRPIAEMAVKAGASKVVIAEGPADPDLNDEVFNSSGVCDLIQELQTKYSNVSISYQNINKDNWTWVNLAEYSTFYGVYNAQELYSYREIRMDQNSYYHAADSNGHNPYGYTPGLYAISNTILEADVLINVPKMKVHMITGVTMSLKNLIGITISDTENMTNQEDIKDVPHWNTSYSHRGEDKERIDTFENDVIWRVNADLHKIAFYVDDNGKLQRTKQRKYLSILDGIVGMEGPLIYDETPDPRPTGVIVAGQDPVAVDMVGCRIMGFNYSVLHSITNMEKVSNHTFGTTNPSSLCILGTPLNSETFRESYVPHINYEDNQTQPYKIRLQLFDPPEPETITTSPKVPRENMETEVLAVLQESDLTAAGWLRYSINDAEPIILQMVMAGETMIGSLGRLESGTAISYEVCLQDYFLNTFWSDKTSIQVATFEIYNILWSEKEYQVTILSNSTITDFNFSQPLKQISFNVTGVLGITGFCNITIPEELLSGEFSLFKDDVPLLIDVNYTRSYNYTHNIFHVTYRHSTHTVKIVSTEVILEFHPYTALILTMIVTTITISIYRKKKQAEKC